MNDAIPERWLPIPGYEELYEVGAQGRVRSLPRPADAVRDGVIRRGERAGSSKLTAEGVQEIRRLRPLGVSQAHLAQRFGVTPSAISRAEHGKNWRHVA